MSRGLGNVQKKVLLLLSAGVGLGFSRSAKTHYRIIKGTSQEWEKLNQRSLREAIRNLYESKLVDWTENNNGSVSLAITDKGKTKILTFDPENLKINKPKKWDGKWRVITFDIPEKRRNVRDALREYFKQLDFFEFQKSVFVYPYDCKDVLDFLIEFYNIRAHVRQILAVDLDNSLDLKNRFDL